MSEINPTESGIELAPGVRVHSGGLRMQFSRSAGPGGQNVNKVNTKAELWLAMEEVTGISMAARGRLGRAAGRKMTQADELHLTCESERTAEGNRRVLFERLRELLVAAMVEPKRRRKTKPTRASKVRRLAAKRHRSGVKSNRRVSGET